MSFFKKFLMPVSNLVEENFIPKEQPYEEASIAIESFQQSNEKAADLVEVTPVIPTAETANNSFSGDISRKGVQNSEDSHDSEETHNTIQNIVVLTDLQGKKNEGTANLNTTSKPVTISSYFKNKGVGLDIPNETLTVAPVESLAFTIAINYPQTKAFIRYLRESITRKRFEFSYVLTAHAPAERNAIISLAEKLNEYGLISNLFHNKTNNTLRGTISTSPRCTNFINGDFLEMYARCVTVGVIKKAAEKYGCDYELYHNVLIHKDAEKHELDIVFRLGDEVFWSEIKSGKFNPDEYRKLGLFMSFVPDKLIMLAAEKSNEAAEAITYFYEYYCANINTFKSTLTNMINKAMEEK